MKNTFKVWRPHLWRAMAMLLVSAAALQLYFLLRIVLMLVIFVFAFFRFTWSMRLYTFGALMVAAAPESKVLDAQCAEGEAWRDAFADRAGRVVGIAAETFNDGLRAYYFAFAAIGWFFSPLLFVLATAVVVYILYQREFRSEVLGVLRA